MSRGQFRWLLSTSRLVLNRASWFRCGKESGCGCDRAPSSNARSQRSRPFVWLSRRGAATNIGFLAIFLSDAVARSSVILKSQRPSTGRQTAKPRKVRGSKAKTLVHEAEATETEA
ncbi:hypothetical protein IE81DRAFT_319685 [Ceraceosorus guamensis]|uniref:Uncharacterized protein n=1 Tax=Ceraceosorus guamensis TaxID=1522189 RepID=A0A316W7I6_9BASI|nr:hypothetical protein IE81DRAFT_319685 [Ceraceosorus guamensis]PWN45847.1 hypothetical protein IE81DRAFT_319685 [Ceraceosorus guamensis]